MRTGSRTLHLARRLARQIDLKTILGICSRLSHKHTAPRMWRFDDDFLTWKGTVLITRMGVLGGLRSGHTLNAAGRSGSSGTHDTTQYSNVEWYLVTRMLRGRAWSTGTASAAAEQLQQA